jgi:GntR family transcriptional regulator/MocR family aminotransferase
MALDLVARVLLGRGDAVAVEALGYRPAWDALAAYGAKLVPVPVDAQGLDVDALARLARRRKLRAVYVTPHHQYPTTATLGAARRLALLELARAHRFAILEDDYDHELNYDGRPILPLAARDEAGTVVYVGTLSKVLAPGLRVGYVVAPRKVQDSLVRARLRLDRQGDLVLERALASLFEEGEIERHALRMRRTYRARRDAFVALLRDQLGDRLSFTVPLGGMALWAEAFGIDVDAWAARARKRRVVLQTGRHFTFDGARLSCLRLGFAALDEDELARAVHILRASIA